MVRSPLISIFLLALINSDKGGRGGEGWAGQGSVGRAQDGAGTGLGLLGPGRARVRSRAESAFKPRPPCLPGLGRGLLCSHKRAGPVHQSLRFGTHTPAAPRRKRLALGGDLEDADGGDESHFETPSRGPPPPPPGPPGARTRRPPSGGCLPMQII